MGGYGSSRGEAMSQTVAILGATGAVFAQGNGTTSANTEIPCPAIPPSFLAEHGVKIAFPITLALSSIALWQRFRELQDEHTANLDHRT